MRCSLRVGKDPGDVWGTAGVTTCWAASSFSTTLAVPCSVFESFEAAAPLLGIREACRSRRDGKGLLEVSSELLLLIVTPLICVDHPNLLTRRFSAYPLYFECVFKDDLCRDGINQKTLLLLLDPTLMK